MAGGCATDLSTRANAVELPPGALQPAPAPGPWTGLLSAEAAKDAWRVVELFSREGLPFEVELAWSSGSGSGARAKLTVAHATRVCVLARSLSVRAANLAAVPQRVGITVADGFLLTRNQYEVTGIHVEGPPTVVATPPFAERVRVELADLSLVTSTLFALRDALGLVRSVYPVATQPAEGLWVGGARSVELATNSSVAFRAVFTLSL